MPRIEWADGFRLNLPDETAVEILATAPWWTAERILTAFGAAMLALFVVFIWGWQLRRRVAAQSVIIARQIEQGVIRHHTPRATALDVPGRPSPLLIMNASPAIRILIVDDHAMVRLALAEAIERQDDLQLVGEAENGAKAIDLHRALRPDVVTMDYQLPDRDGEEIIAAIKSEFPDARILLLSIFETEECVYRATQAGAIGYVSKAAEIDEMIEGIRTVARGESYFSAGLAAKLDERCAREGLSRRELEVLKHLATGLSNKEIGAALDMAASTVKHHLERIFAKLDAKDRTQAVTIAAQRGVLRIADR